MAPDSLLKIVANPPQKIVVDHCDVNQQAWRRVAEGVEKRKESRKWASDKQRRRRREDKSKRGGKGRRGIGGEVVSDLLMEVVAEGMEKN
ncbi:hypothetical protein ACH5RR_001629 [Cinchona calisaya]|uniref:Uncharacterized protein n=1 Tax=Cinchona calisaya TaxID=153742 RepID=A0ABD3B4R6_9GENT